MLKKLHISTLGLIILFLLVISGKFLFEIDPLHPLEYKVYDYLLRLRQRQAATQVVVLAIDSQSIEAIGSWPWPRSYIAATVRELTGGGAHTMGLSLLYPSKEINPGLEEIRAIQKNMPRKPPKAARKTIRKISGYLTEAAKKLNHDQQLISAVRAARRVVLPLRLNLDDSPNGHPEPISAWLELNSLDKNSHAAAEDGLQQANSGFRGILKT